MEVADSSSDEVERFREIDRLDRMAGQEGGGQDIVLLDEEEDDEEEARFDRQWFHLLLIDT